MNFHIMTLFPEMIQSSLSSSITGRAENKGYIGLNNNFGNRYIEFSKIQYEGLLADYYN